MLWLILALVYCVRYRNNQEPPNNDIISPLITIIFALMSSNIIIAIALLFEAVADYYIGSRFKFAVKLFAISHGLKHFIMMNEWYSIMLCIITWLVIIFNNKYYVTESYALCLCLTLIQTILFRGSPWNEFCLFVLSDIIIILDKEVYKFPRMFRIWTVPLLYWTSQYMLIL